MPASAFFSTGLSRRLEHLLERPVLRPLGGAALLGSVDGWLAQVDPMRSLTGIRARVLAVEAENADTKSFWLQPNGRWPGHTAGQHLEVEIEQGGVRKSRFYSLSSAPAPGQPIRITVKRPQTGRVSAHLHDRVRVGDVLRLGAPAGDFGRIGPQTRSVLMLSAGSGITPMRSVLGMLRNRSPSVQVTLVHSCRDEKDLIFGSELRQWASEWPQFELLLHFSATHGRLDPGRLATWVPDYADRETLLCGPAGFMAAFKAHYAEAGLSGRLQCEHFGPVLKSETATGVSSVCSSRTGREFQARHGESLLTQAEAAGWSPRSGCRAGICQSCKCRKVHGTVENLLTGTRSSEPGELIQLCISAPRTDLVLEL